jgi:hypothetical protein
MLGVNATTDSVFRLEKVVWRRTLGWKRASSYLLLAPSNPNPAEAGSETVRRRRFLANDQGRTTNDGSHEDDI